MDYQSLYSRYLSECASDRMYSDGHREPSSQDLLTQLQDELASIYEDGETLDDVDIIYIYTPAEVTFLLDYLEGD